MKPILVHIHIYYKFLYEELRHCIDSLKGHEYRLFITLVEDDREFIEKIHHDLPEAVVEVVPNLGFDLGPFVHVLNQEDLNNYSYVIKLHTKRDIPTKEDMAWFAGPRWRNALLKFMRTKESFNKALAIMEENPKIGMHGPNIATFNRKSDDHHAQRVVNKFLEEKGLPRIRYNFIGGTMFMVRASILNFIKDLGITQQDFEVPDKSHEGCQMAHIFERLCGYMVYKHGLKIVDCTSGVFVSRLIYALLTIKNVAQRTVFTVRITKKNKLLVKIFKIPVLAIKLKDKTDSSKEN